MEIVTKEMLDEFKQELKRDLSEINNNISQHYPKKLMKNQDLMDYLGCSYTTIEKLRASNKLPYKKVMGTYYYSIDEVNRVFLERL